ncbi:ABC-2 type transporter, partial [mine drainage metagenome]
DKFRDAMLMFPLLDTVEMFHAGYFGERMHTYYSVSYTIMANLVMTFTGLLLTQLAIRRVTV